MLALVIAALGMLTSCGQAAQDDRTGASVAGSSEVSSGLVEGSDPISGSVAAAEADAGDAAAKASSEADADDAAPEVFTMQAPGGSLTATFADTEAARELAAALSEGPITVSLHSYGGFEKVGLLPMELTAADERIAAEPGDVMLYQGNQITVFFGSNTWEYTPLAHVDGATADQIEQVLGEDEVEVVLTL